jgi:hypothetical protein
MFGPTPPSIFVGHSFYPNVCWGPLVSAAPVEDEPSQMYGMGMEEIIAARSSLVRGMSKGNVKMQGRMLSEAQEAVMSIKPVDAEARFSRTPLFRLELDDISHPVGASAPIEKFRMAENPSIPKRVDALSEGDVLANDALSELLLSGFDVHYLSKLLSAGILGKSGAKKMVPTKWAITATDDMAAKRLMGMLRHFRQADCPLVYSNTYLGNHFEILLLPGSWEYEQFECALTPELERLHKKRTEKRIAGGSVSANLEVNSSASTQQPRCGSRVVHSAEEHLGAAPPSVPQALAFRPGLLTSGGTASSPFSQAPPAGNAIRYSHAAWADWKYDGRVNISEEHEPFAGRSGYASRQGGGYYAARLGVCEGLYAMKRQARAVVFREIGTDYTVPVGVWEVRENVRHAFLSQPEKFATMEEALSHLSCHLAVPMGEYAGKSTILSQRKLTEF